MFTKKQVETEALGWLELTEDPVKPTWAGCGRAIKRAIPGVLFIIVVFVVIGTITRVLGFMPQID